MCGMYQQAFVSLGLSKQEMGVKHFRLLIHGFP